MSRSEAVWLATTAWDMRARNEAAPARVGQLFGGAKLHNSQPLVNQRATGMRVAGPLRGVMLICIITGNPDNAPAGHDARRADFEIPEALRLLGNGPVDGARPAAEVLQSGVLLRYVREGVEQEPHKVLFARCSFKELVGEPVGSFKDALLDGKGTHDFSLAGPRQDVPYECPVQGDGQAQLLWRDVEKLVADVLQDGFPVLAAFRMVLQLQRHDDDVLD